MFKSKYDQKREFELESANYWKEKYEQLALDS